jgi:F-type H+-transporting ATPase subunit delta
MKIPRRQITPVLADLTLKSGASAKRLSRDVAAYLLDEGRTGELDSLMRDVIAYRAQKGIVEVTAVSAYELSEITKRDITKLVREQFPAVKQIILNQRIDADVVGGMRLELVDEQVDLTIRNKLNRLKELTTVERA